MLNQVVSKALTRPERPATLVFYYYGDVGFGVLPDDSEQLVVRVKRREG